MSNSSSDPDFEPLIPGEFVDFKGGTTLLLPLILFFIQVALLFVMCYQNVVEESLIREASITARMSGSNTKTNNENNTNNKNNNTS
ncbi:hypothetical protein ACHWQZ_G011125 [Mnemiopsis leidyi]